MNLPARDCWFLTGPTASGKTAVGLRLAEFLDAEIISLDSMAIYRDMDIGTAKPSQSDRSRITHHLIDIVNPTDEYSFSAYVDDAHEKVLDIRQRGKEVLFVGGTPLYLKGLLRGIFEGPPADWEFRHQVMDEVRRVGTEALHDRLKQVDPLSASRLHPNNVRRIIRALEVHRAIGRPISHLQMQFDEAAPRDATRVFVLDLPRTQLHQQIEQRVESMFATGLIDEARALRERYQQLSRTASQAVGYREAFAHLDGQYDKGFALQRMKSRTRQFAKRQLTWFRSLSECRPVSKAWDDSAVDVARRIIDASRQSQPDSEN